jgi:CheY-like chemotaxis protein
MSRQKRILVIDDDPDFIEYITVVLSANGYIVDTASSVVEGLRLMHSNTPDLVIADMMISYRLDGCTIIRRMRMDPHLKSIPILIVSAVMANKEDTLCPASESDEISAFMCKPLDPSPLLQCVAELTQHTDSTEPVST